MLPTYVPAFRTTLSVRKAIVIVAKHVLHRGEDVLDVFLRSDERWRVPVDYVVHKLAVGDEDE